MRPNHNMYSGLYMHVSKEEYIHTCRWEQLFDGWLHTCKFITTWTTWIPHGYHMNMCTYMYIYWVLNLNIATCTHTHTHTHTHTPLETLLCPWWEHYCCVRRNSSHRCWCWLWEVWYWGRSWCHIDKQRVQIPPSEAATGAAAATEEGAGAAVVVSGTVTGRTAEERG